MLEDQEDTPKLSRRELERLAPELAVELLEAQAELREQGRRSVLVVLTGDDRVGCNEVYDRLHEWLDARYLVARTFADPPAVDLERPFAFPFWRELPPRGRLGLFFGAWPAAALVERCRDGGGEARFARRLEIARELERTLADDGTVVVKLWVHLSPKQHRERLERAERGKRTGRDVLLEELDREILEHLDEALPEVEQLLEETDAPHAPWHVIDGSDDEGRDLTAGRCVLEALRAALDAPLDAAQEAPQDAAPRRSAGGAAGTPGSHGARTLDTVDLTRRLEHDEYERRLDAQQARLAELTRAARRSGVSMVLAFEGRDAAGKGGAIKRLTRAMAARDYRVIPIGAPTPDELARCYQWRFWRELPRAGRTVIFDRSWYGRVLVERVERLAPPEAWRRAYGEIVEFERQLAEAGVVLAKFWLQIDADEQLRRFRAREETASKRHKLGPDDWRNRSNWDAYTAAADELLARTDTPEAPWTLVSAQDKRWARVRVIEAVVAALEAGLERHGPS